MKSRKTSVRPRPTLELLEIVAITALGTVLLGGWLLAYVAQFVP